LGSVWVTLALTLDYFELLLHQRGIIFGHFGAKVIQNNPKLMPKLPKLIPS
jgi:hypothetical protein